MVDARDVVEVVGSAAAGAGAGAIAYRAWRNTTERTIMDGKPTTLQRVEAARLSADANTFQFKSGGDGAGVTDRLSGVTKWNPAAAGKVMVYEFADGRQVIADGHQRLGLAKRLMSEGHEPIKMDAIVLRQSDGWQPRDVRAYAAIKNMHESSGHSLDMARVMRERPDLVTGSLPISDAKIREAKSLARLSEPAFNMVASGTVKPDVAAAVGDAVKDSSRHLDYLNEMTKAKVASGQHARLYVQQAMAAPSLTETTGSLFGEETTTRSLLKERAQVLDKALTALKQDKRIFGLLEREAGTIEAVGNRLSHAANAERATGAGRLAEMVEKLSTTRGPISEMLDRAAAAIAKGEAPAKAARAFVKDVGDTMKRGGISALTGNVPGRMQAMADDGKPSPRGMDGLTRAERSGRAAPLTAAPSSAPAGASMMERFQSAYEATLTERVRANPERYAYGVDRVPEFARKMTEALAAGRGDHQSPTVQAVAKSLGIKPTLGHLQAALSGQPAPVKAKVEGLSPQQMAAVKRAITSGASVNKDALAKATNAQLAALDDVALAARRGQTGGGGDWGKINGIEAWRSQIKDFARQTSQAAVDASMERQNPGWSDAARAASADQRGVARPGEAKDGSAREQQRMQQSADQRIRDRMSWFAETQRSDNPLTDAERTALANKRPEYEFMRPTTKSPGQLAYEQDVAAKPTYHDGGKRKTWAQLGEAEKGTWEKNPTPRFQHKQPESYWSTKAPPTPTVADLPPGAFKGTDKEFSSLSPGMRREIERAAERRNPQPASSFDSREAPKGQTSFIPPPTTKEKLTAAAASKGKPSIPQQPMDQGLFGSGMKQLDLVEMAKGKPPATRKSAPSGVTYSAEQAERDRVSAGTKRVGDSVTDRYSGGMANHPKRSMATATSTVSIEPVVGPKGSTGEYQIVERHYVGRGEGQREVGKTVYTERYSSHDAAFRQMDSASGKNPGWQDAAREASAKERGVALPGQAKVPKGTVKEAMAAITSEEKAAVKKAALARTERNVALAEKAGVKVSPDRLSAARDSATTAHMVASNAEDFERHVKREIAKTAKAPKTAAKPSPGLTAAAQSAGVRDPNADMAKMFGPNLKPTAPTDQAAKSARADEFARRNFGKGETKPKRSKGSKALAMLGPVAIAGAAAVAFDATRSQAQAAGDSAAAANTKATGAAVAAGGAVAAVSWGIGKGLMLAAKGAGVVAPRAAALVLPGGAMFLAGMAAYGVTTAAAEGYKKGGVSGATTGALDWATMGAASHFGPRLTAAGASMFEAADAAYRAMKPQAATTDQDSARKPGWGPESRIEAARARGAALLPYGGNPENAPGYIPPVTLPDAPKPKK